MSFSIFTQRRFKATGIRVDLGCGAKCRSGFTGLDSRECGQQLLWDARHGLPFPDSTIKHLFSSHFIEHLTDQEAADIFVEILRIMDTGGVVEMRCPHSSSREAWFHSHLTRWNEERIKGIVLGFHGRAASGEKHFSTEKLTQEGFELAFILRIKIKK